MKIIIGLGNPGEKYKLTRHNIGFMIIDALAKELGLAWQENKKFNSLVAKEGELLLIKPQTFMNLSGQAARAALAYYQLLPKRLGLTRLREADLSKVLIIVHDEIDITVGKYKIAVGSRSAGHNGVQSVIDHLKTNHFVRYRIGVRGDSIGQIPVEKFVLNNFSEEELISLKGVITEVVGRLATDN